MKKLLKIILILLVFITSLSFNTQCWFTSLQDDLKAASAEFKAFIKNDSEAFASYEILYNQAPALKTNVGELTLVSKNLDEIDKAGGYLKWRAIKRGGASITKFDKKFIDYINQFDNVVTNPDKHTKVWRVMRDNQLMSNPIVAKSETGLTQARTAYTVAGHVGKGSHPNAITPYISTWTNKDGALARAIDDGGLKVVEIDLTKINGKFIDLSNEGVRKSFITHPRTAFFAESSSEFLIIVDEIPITAFKQIN